MLMKRNMLTAEQVAQRLGVKTATVYAYVSRGVLTRSLAPDGRTSRFDPTEVDAIARRGRPRPDVTRRGTIDVSLATSITRIEPARLSYRGHDATTLATTASFERVAELLWTGELPEHATWSAPDSSHAVAKAISKSLSKTSSPLDRFGATCAAIAPIFPLRNDLRPSTVLLHARILATTFVASLPARKKDEAHRKHRAKHERQGDGDLIARRLWGRLTSLAPNDARVKLLDAALVLLADHELATSTISARVAASCRANPFAVVLAGLGALHGPLHGGAANACHRMLVDAAESAPEIAVEKMLEGGMLRGFGHPVYRGADPRAVFLLEKLRQLGARRDLAIVDAVIASATSSGGEAVNVDFALAAIAFALQMSVGATDAIFAIARTAGFVAHALEEYSEAPLRFRARAIYVGADNDA